MTTCSLGDSETVLETKETLLFERTLTIAKDEPTRAEPGRVDPAAARLESQSFAERYEVQELLGKGGMGAVSSSLDRRIGREVAIKVIAPNLEKQRGLRTRFAREACLQGQLEHPSIVPVYDLGISDSGQSYFTMKRVRGCSLREIVDGLRAGKPEFVSRFSVRKLLNAFATVCLTIEYAHERGVVHRDLKPSNIMLGDFGEVYVLDWGLAKIVDNVHGTDDTTPRPVVGKWDCPTRGAPLGTPGYMAPEQIADPSRINGAADIYALGVMLFEILTFLPLHRGFDRDGLLRSTLQGAEARASIRDPDNEYPPELEAICVRATRFVPQERFRTARELHDALDRYLNHDRDLELRQELALRHGRAANDAMQAAFEGTPEQEGGRRSIAMREIGRCLALDPQNRLALETMVRLLVEPPKAIPEGASEEIRRSYEKTCRESERLGARAYLACFLALPVLFWMGFSGVSATTLAFLILGANVVLHIAAARLQERRPFFYSRLILSTAAIMLLSTVFGHLILVPALAAANTMGFALNPDRNKRKYVVMIGCLAVVVPGLLEAVGLIPPFYAFQEGMMQVLSGPELARAPSMLFLTFTSIGLIMVSSWYAGRIRNSLTSAETKLILYSWHLRRMLPDSLDTGPRVRASTRPAQPVKAARTSTKHCQVMAPWLDPSA